VSKADQLRALREARFAAQRKEASPIVVANAVANADVAHAVSHADVANTKSTYRYRDPAKRRSYQRDLMRKRRAAVR
jgi:hypothetical protein